MTWFKVDDGFYSSRKVLSIPRGQRLAAVGLWTLAGNWSGKELTDGKVENYVLAELGATPKLRQALVEARLWLDRGEKGIEFYQWSKYQPTRAQVQEERAKTAERQRRHRERNRDDGVSNADVTRDSGVSHDAPSRPVPTRPTEGLTESSHVPNREADSTDEGVIRARRAVLSGLGIKDFGKVKAAIVAATSRDVSDEQAQGIIGGLLAKATGPVRYPQAYVLCSITESWAEVQQAIDEEEEAS